jgi:hypothetical protein
MLAVGWPRPVARFRLHQAPLELGPTLDLYLARGITGRHARMGSKVHSQDLAFPISLLVQRMHLRHSCCTGRGRYESASKNKYRRRSTETKKPR